MIAHHSPSCIAPSGCMPTGRKLRAGSLEIDDRVRFTLTGEKCRVVESTHGSKTLRWPSGDRIAYATNDGIWQHFTKQY